MAKNQRKPLKPNEAAKKLGTITFDNHKKYAKAVSLVVAAGQKAEVENVLAVYVKLGGLYFENGQPKNQIIGDVE